MPSFKMLIVCMSVAFCASLANPIIGQECESCVDVVSDCQSVVNGNGSCGAMGGGCLHSLKGQLSHLREINRVVTARNEAWPKPFGCADRQLYFQMWDPMLEAGWKSACVFNQRHFDEGTADLNQAGRMKVAAIMRNYPIGQKAFYLEREMAASLSDERLMTLKNSVEKWFGLSQVTEIGFADVIPLPGNGSRAKAISEGYIKNLPDPVIPVQNLGASLDAAGSGG